jgi:carboxymethylenebutenolidase
MTDEEYNGWTYDVSEGTSKVGVVLVHDIMGVDEVNRSIGAQLAENGFWVALVDLFKGQLPANIEEGFGLRSALSREEILDCLAKGRDLLAEKIGDGAQIGSMGFCMGGGFALLGACNLGLAFCADYYGMIEDPEEVEGLAGPVMHILASEDDRITPWAYESFMPAMKAHKKRIDSYLYPNTAHGFHRPNSPMYDEDAAKDAWEKTIAFISRFK